jgi:S1-C subfamily serine protease
MKKMIGLLSALVLSLGAQASTKVIYGEDNRVDVYASTNAMYVELAASTAAMISTSSLSQRSDGTMSVSGGSLTSRGMCASERFANQKSAANCSGFLVGEDTLVTAGHCIDSQSACNSYSWVFGFKMENADQLAQVDASNVYRCKSIVKTVLDRSTSNDFAVIKLDRKVTDRRILEFRNSGTASVGDNLVVIGHPTGLPTKIADGSKVRSLKGTYFVANLDTYGGNSGSAVFNADTGLIEGILVRGETDYIYRGSCRVSNVIGDNEGRGEDVTYAKEFAPFVQL